MTQNVLTKELADKFMKLSGEARGVTLKTDADFVLREKGKEALEKVEAELERLGYPIEYEKIKTMDFYPFGARLLSLLIIQKIFNFSAKDMKRMGSQAPKSSLIIKLFTKYFLSLTQTGEQAPKIWQKNYTIGEMSVEPHEEEKWTIIRLKNFNLHPLFCPYLEGYISRVVSMIVGAPVTSQETKCPFKEDQYQYHEYLIKW